MRTLFLFFLLPLFLQSRIVEIQHIEEVLPYLEEKPLIIMDIDNTLIKTAQQLGSDQWFYHTVETYKQSHPHDEAFKKALSEWHKVVSLTKVLPAESKTKQVMDQIFSSGLPVMALTTRGFWLEDVTKEQLASIGISFNPTSLTKKELLFDNEKPVLFCEGVLYTNGTHKGKALYQLLDHLQLKPEKILFVNDRETHLAQLGATVEERGATFTGLRYGHLDKEVASFNPELANLQWKHFGLVLSDADAKHLLELQQSN